MEKMPSSIKVGPHVYAVILTPTSGMPPVSDEDDRKCLGTCEFDKLIIRIKKGLRKSKAQETLWHEIQHACTYPELIDTTATDERFIDYTSSSLLGVIKDNPDLIRYLTS